MAHKNDGKKRLDDLSNRFHEAPQGAERNESRLTLLNLSSGNEYDSIEKREMERVETHLWDLSESYKKSHPNISNSNIQFYITQTAVRLKTNLSTAQLFHIITETLDIDYDKCKKFFDSLPLELQNFFKRGINT